MSSDNDTTAASFMDLGLPEHLINAVNAIGYTTPTPIQEQMIPHMLEGKDVVGQAQTGTGKTAAFALPILANLGTSSPKVPQILVLAPTRELAIQVADSFSNYSKHIKRLNILPVFGGQDYNIQLRQIKKGCQIIVGTPGRIIDHIRRGSLGMDAIHTLVLDEADEMLRMGFLDDVEWILEQLPKRTQTALFSATMPPNIRKIARKYLDAPVEITIQSKVMTANTVQQRCLITNGGFANKIDTLSKVLESEDFDGILIFVRTKMQTVELAEKICSLGYAAAALNGDIQQSQRLRTIEQLKTKKIDILVATDVAARGLDVERISHVINFDIPFDTEAYVHRIGRTGRAGRTGHAILFVNPRERSMLRSIERATKQNIEMMQLPTVADINKKRVKNFKDKISNALSEDTSFYHKLIEDYLEETSADITDVAAALALLTQGQKPLLAMEEKQPRHQPERDFSSKSRQPRRPKQHNVQLPPEEGLERFRIEAGTSHGVKPGNIVGAIANEADINSKYIGRISIFDDYSTVDLPYGMPEKTLHILQKARIGSRMMQIHRVTDVLEESPSRRQNGPRRNKGAQKKRRSSGRQGSAA